MPKLKIEIDMSGEAFQEHGQLEEAQRIIDTIWEQLPVEDDDSSINLRDVRDCICGIAKITGD